MHDAALLIVDDELMVRRLLGDALMRIGYRVELARNGEEAKQCLSRGGVQLMLLDLQLGDMDGIEVMSFARERWPNLPIIMLTAHGSLDSAIAAVRHQAADYLLKPISVDTLRERVASVLADHVREQRQFEYLQEMYHQMHAFLQQEGRLSQPTQRERSQVLVGGPLQLDVARHQVSMKGQPVDVTPSEFMILQELLEHTDAVVSCRILARATGTMVNDEEEGRQLIRPHVVRLRRKLEQDPQLPHYLVSVRGYGYRWASKGDGTEQ